MAAEHDERGHCNGVSRKGRQKNGNDIRRGIDYAVLFVYVFGQGV